MNKKLIAVAVAAAMTAPLAAQAAPTVYGKIHMSVLNNDIDNGAERLSVLNNSTRVGVKGSEDLGGGLKAIYKLEWTVNVSGANEGRGSVDSFGAARNSYIGLKGGFGTALVGRHDNAYKMVSGKFEVMPDTALDLGRGGAVDLLDSGNEILQPRDGSLIMYQSPKFSGVQIIANIVAGEEDGNVNGVNGDADGLADGYSIAATYTAGPLYLTAAYTERSRELTSLSVADNLDTPVTNEARTVNNPDDDQAYLIGGEYNFGVGEVAVFYQSRELGTGANDEIDTFGITGKYKIGGNNDIRAVYISADNDAPNSDQDVFGIALYHSFSKKTAAYIQYGTADNDSATTAGNDQDVFALGMYHSF